MVRLQQKLANYWSAVYRNLACGDGFCFISVWSYFHDATWRGSTLHKSSAWPPRASRAWASAACALPSPRSIESGRATFRPSWMDVPPMIYSGNPLLCEPGMVFFLHAMLANTDAGYAMSFGHTLVITDNGREVLSGLPIELASNS